MNFSLSLKSKSYDLGQKSFSEEEVISFAKVNDPLEFHTNVELAKKSRFNGLVCSGSQAFNYFYVNRWIPLFGNTVVAGMSVNNWNFLAPIYAEDNIKGNCQVKEIYQAKNSAEWIVTWAFEFELEDRSKVQELELTIMHKQIDSSYE